jgi:hypothetical protein
MSRPGGAAGPVPGHGIGWQTPILADPKRCAAACRGPRRCATLWERWDEVAAGLSPPAGGPTTSGGRLAQRESASFTPRRSLVRSQYRPPGQTPCRSPSTSPLGAIPVTVSTQRKHPARSPGAADPHHRGSAAARALGGHRPVGPERPGGHPRHTDGGHDARRAASRTACTPTLS